MANILPTVPFPGYEFKAAAAAVTADSIVIPLTALAGLTSVEANATTGDGRKVCEAIVRESVQNILALAAANRPVSFIVAQNNAAAGGAPGRYTQTYTATAIVDAEVGVLAELVTEPA